ncbi:MAG: hypothetical protein FJW14_06335 [Acidimicrobiia bacterium]|nr:hypothetical protein [Acidimicrobiia bacterium]
MRNDARAGAELAGQDRPELHVERGEQVEGDDRRVGNVGLERIADLESHQPFDARLLRVLLGIEDPGRVDVHADAAGAELLGGHDDDPAVPAAQVVDHIFRAHAGQGQHPLDDVGRGDHEGRPGRGAASHDGLGGNQGSQEHVGHAAHSTGLQLLEIPQVTGTVGQCGGRTPPHSQRSKERVKVRKTAIFRPVLVDPARSVGYTCGCSSRHETRPTTNNSCNGGNVTFQVGDKVIYPNHGLGIVERIEEKTILGTTCGFFHLRIVSNDTTVLVPVANVDGVGLRKAISDEEVERLFTLLSDGRIDNHQNWKGRFKDNSDKMRTGSIYDMADVLKSLTFLSKSKSLSFREKRMLDRAKALIISEISEVIREKAIEVEQKVDRALEKCFMVKARNMARASARAKVTKPIKAAVVAAAPRRAAARAS